MPGWSEEEHEAYAISRTPTGGYVYVPSDPRHDEAMDFYVDGDDSSPFVVIGERRCGKTALLSNWLERRRARPPVGGPRDAEFVFAHFVGCTPRSMYLRHVLSRLEMALKEFFGLRDMEVPKSEERLRWGLNRFLEAAARKRRGDHAKIVIIVDGANLLQSEDAELGKLHWLPTNMPGSVRFILSTTEYDNDAPHSRSQWCMNHKHRTYTELMRRQCPSLNIVPLTKHTRKKIVDAFLQIPSLSLFLDENNKERITSMEISSQPLFLRLLLNAIRLESEVNGATEVGSYLDQYLTAGSTDNLLAQILARWMSWVESDFLKNASHKKSVKGSVLFFIFCAILASRNGLRAEELWGLVKFGLRKDLSFIQKDRVLRILQDFCIVVNGYYLFFSSAVKDALLGLIESPSSSIHLLMARFFENVLNEIYFVEKRSVEHTKNDIKQEGSCASSINNACHRQLSCIVWHFEVAGMWINLKDLLIDIKYFHLWCQKDEFIHLWASLTSIQQLDPRGATSLVTGPFCHKTMPFHQSSRPIFDPVEEYTKSIDTYRTQRGVPDGSLRKTAIEITIFLLELSLKGHEEDASVPAFHHPTLDTAEMASLGVPYVDHHDHTFVLPRLHESMDPEDIEDRQTLNVDEKSPMRSTYFFHRFVWIHFPIMALEEREEVKQDIIRENRALKQYNGLVNETKATSHHVEEKSECMEHTPMKSSSLPSVTSLKARKRLYTANYTPRKRKESANDDVVLLNQLRAEYDGLVQLRSKQALRKEYLCTELQNWDRGDNSNYMTKQQMLQTKHELVTQAQETEDAIYDNYTTILKACRRNPAHVPSLINEMEMDLNESTDLIQSSSDAIRAVAYETASTISQFYSIQRGQQETGELYRTMILNRQQQKEKIKMLMLEEELATKRLTELNGIGGASSPQLKSPQPKGTTNLSHECDGNESSTYNQAVENGQHSFLILDDIKDRTGIGKIDTFASTVVGACGKICEDIDDMQASSENYIKALRNELQGLREESKDAAMLLAETTTDGFNDEKHKHELQIIASEEKQSLLEENFDAVKSLQLSLREGVESVACSLGIQKRLLSSEMSILELFKHIDCRIVVLECGLDQDKERPCVTNCRSKSYELKTAIAEYRANRKSISLRRKAGPLLEPGCEHQEVCDIFVAMQLDRREIKDDSGQVVRTEQMRAAQKQVKKK